ncbi:MAG: hypothetical protein LAT68_10680 [Cyclobacteriaceae bacterium]|nr:hypothetical protein [Cyclobacteriaceae bacterium]MCH8516781.1 hypothetical protein [Cyclobacteriaceae bacterium]
MKEDINIPKVEGIKLAMVPDTELGAPVLPDTYWKAHLINTNSYAIEGVLINTKGYGEIDGRAKETGTFRHHIDVLEGGAAAAFETLPPDLLQLNNEFMLTYFHDGKLFDRKYIFETGSIQPDRMQHIDELKRDGVVLV